MAKFTNPSKLSREEQEKLIIGLCRALSLLRSPIEAAQFLKDILSAQEAEMLAKRLKVAELLVAGLTYVEISKDLKVSSATIAKVYEWLKLSGDGYRLVLERMPKKEKGTADSLDEKFDPFSWRNVKRRYPLYFWPQLLIEKIIKSAKEKDKKKFREILEKMDKKSALYKQINKALKH